MIKSVLSVRTIAHVKSKYCKCVWFGENLKNRFSRCAREAVTAPICPRETYTFEECRENEFNAESIKRKGIRRVGQKLSLEKMGMVFQKLDQFDKHSDSPGPGQA